MKRSTLDTVTHFAVSPEEKSLIRAMTDEELSKYQKEINTQWLCCRAELKKQKLWNILSMISIERVKRKYGQ
jgi:hypothetical protein